MVKRLIFLVLAVFLLFIFPGEGFIEAATKQTPVNSLALKSLEYGRFSGKTSDSFNGEKTVKFALNLLGSPYKWGGETPDGFDCSGFTMYVFENAASIKLPRTAACQSKVGIKTTKLSKGDIVYFKTSGKGVSHVGLYIGENNFIHAVKRDGVIISSLGEKYWKKRFLGARSFYQ